MKEPKRDALSAYEYYEKQGASITSPSSPADRVGKLSYTEVGGSAKFGIAEGDLLFHWNQLIANSGSSFFISLLQQYDSNQGKLTIRQWRALIEAVRNKIAKEGGDNPITGSYPAARTAEDTESPMPSLLPKTTDWYGVYTLLQKASASIKYPKIRIDDGYQLYWSARYDSVGIKRGREHIGKITNTGKLSLYATKTTEAERESLSAKLAHLATDPAGFAKIYGIKTSTCCFCARELITKASVAAGYGPICAEKYGLPHGELN